MPQQRLAPAQRQQIGHETLRVGLGARPVQPAGGIVLAVGVVVALLAVAELVAGTEHRRALGQQQAGQHRATHAQAQLGDGGIHGRALDAEVGAEFLVAAIAVVFAVGEVVLAGVRDHVGQCEAVMHGDEVDRTRRAPLVVVEQVVRGDEPAREFATIDAPAQPVAAHRIAELVVPLQEPAGEAPDLVTVRARVPRLGDHPRARQHRVLAQRGEERGVRIEAVLVAAEHRRQVEAEAVHAHLRDPVAQGVEHELGDLGMGDVERVAAAAEVFAAAAVVAHQPVPAGVVQAAEAGRGAQLAALRRVVVDDVEHHLEAGGVQGIHHGAELRGGGVGIVRGERQARIGAEEAEGVVTPVVDQAAFDQVLLVHRVLHRQQGQGGDAERMEMRDRRRMRKPGIGAAQCIGDAGVAHREPLHVHLVQHHVGVGDARRRGGEGCRSGGRRHGNPRLQRDRRVVARIEHAQSLWIAERIAVLQRIPAELADDLARARV